ncbi:hypothetical protein GRI44_01650 [Altererythrobacter confluentis]|uniref:Bacterial dipeptidyl-peptidase SH3 domain-containing protein n=1 Tax=Allopontixanthobacter confluentis TaxID=1849021 RepID=A0A6L7GBY7_9SPHN|nr:hypothetical protein [Allopontixanthobacter confluentis]
MNKAGTYELPEGLLALDGPVVRPKPGTLPIRGDLAHIALADKFLVAHYVVPQTRPIGGADVELKLAPRDDAETVTTLAAGSYFEVMDFTGTGAAAWAWGCCGPDGPTGYVPASTLAAPQQ